MTNGRRPAWRQTVARALPAIAAVLVLLVLWELYARLSGIRPTTLPAPSRIAVQAWANRATLIDNTIPTIKATLIGFSLSLAAAFVLSVLLDFSKLMRQALIPLFIISQTLPLVAIAPLVVLWLGFGLLPKILLVALVTFFPMLVAWLRGFGASEPEIEDLLYSMGATRFGVFHRARLPAALPYFFAGFRISITYAVVGAIFAEYAGAAKGLGIYILNAKNSFRPDLVLAAVFISAGLTLVLFGATVLVERLLVRWRPVND
ncbi:ABC transporter permease [Martelella endophytica]